MYINCPVPTERIRRTSARIMQLPAFAMVVLMYGMETAFFQLLARGKARKGICHRTDILAGDHRHSDAGGLNVSARNSQLFRASRPNGNYVRNIRISFWQLDALSNLPLAWLRFKKMPLKFELASSESRTFLVNVGGNLITPSYCSFHG